MFNIFGGKYLHNKSKFFLKNNFSTFNNEWSKRIILMGSDEIIQPEKSLSCGMVTAAQINNSIRELDKYLISLLQARTLAEKLFQFKGDEMLTDDEVIKLTLRLNKMHVGTPAIKEIRCKEIPLVQVLNTYPPKDGHQIQCVWNNHSMAIHAGDGAGNFVISGLAKSGEIYVPPQIIGLPQLLGSQAIVFGTQGYFLNGIKPICVFVKV